MRELFIKLSQAGLLPFSHVCARFGISRKTGYKWLKRFHAEGPAGLLERNRAPRSHPRRHGKEVEAAVMQVVRELGEASSGRVRRELAARGFSPLPAVTTIDTIRRRTERAELPPAAARPAPNSCWCLETGPVCLWNGINHRAVILRDRATGFVLAAEVVAERGQDGAREVLWGAFARQGLPQRLRWLLPASGGGTRAVGVARHTALSVDVMRLGVAVEFADETSGGDDSVWVALEQRLAPLAGRSDASSTVRQALSRPAPAPLTRAPQEPLQRWQGRLAAWANHENVPATSATGFVASPAALYRPSPRALDTKTGPAVLEGATVRRVSEKGLFFFCAQRWWVGRPFAGELIEVRRLAEPGAAAVYFNGQPLGLIRTSRRTSATPQTLLPVISTGTVKEN